MTSQAVAPSGLWLSEFGVQTASLNSLLIDASGEKAAYVFQAPKTGNIDKVGFRTAAVTAGMAATVRLETVDANGDPSGVLAAVGASATQTLVTGTDTNKFIEVTLDSVAPVTQGDRLAIVVGWVSPGVVNLARLGGAATLFGTPYCDLFTSSWTKFTGFCLGSIRYDDGTYGNVGGMLPIDTIGTDSFQDSTNPDERGNKITIPFKCNVKGLWHYGSAATGDFVSKLYDNASGLLASKAWDSDNLGLNPRRILFNNEVTLSAGDIVYASILGTDVTNTGLIFITCPAGMSAALPGGGAMVYTTRNNGGAWTDVPNKLGGIGLIISGLDDGLGGGAVETARSFAM